MDAVLQVGSHKSRVEGQNPLPRPAGHAAFDAAQDMVPMVYGFQSREGSNVASFENGQRNMRCMCWSMHVYLLICVFFSFVPKLFVESVLYHSAVSTCFV